METKTALDRRAFIKTTAAGACGQNRTPYQRMKRAVIPSKNAEAACFWTACPTRVTILDDPKYKDLYFILPQSVNHVCKLDSTIGLPS